MGGKPAEIDETVVLEKNVRTPAEVRLSAVLKVQAVLIRNGPEDSSEPGAAHPVVRAMKDQPPVAPSRERAAPGAPELAGNPPGTALYEISKAHGVRSLAVLPT
jgi:hypothetical protein